MTTRSSGVTIRRAGPIEPWPEITALLHRAYAVHAARGLRFYASYQDADVTRERAGEGECYLALVDGVIVATITALPAGRQSECSWYARSDTASMGQLAVDPAFQRRGIGTSLMNLAEERARQWGPGGSPSTPPSTPPTSSRCIAGAVTKSSTQYAGPRPITGA